VTFVLVPILATVPAQLRETAHNQVWLWTFLLNWSAPYGKTVAGFGHFWSLAVEEQFYLLWPFVVARCNPRQVLRVGIALALASLAARWLLTTAHFPPDALYMFTVSRMDALALGAAAAALLRIPAARTALERRVAHVAVTAAIVLGGTFLLTRGFAAYDPRSQSFGYTTLALGFAGCLLVTAVPVRGLPGLVIHGLRWRPLRAVGRYSYGMYVFHMPLHVFFGVALLHHLVGLHPTHAAAFAYITAVVLVSFGIAALSYYYFERHFLKLKEKLLPRGTLALRLSLDGAPR
jgi:peptidoglycan/LPS O-acetylase OafA/YrhL